MKISAGSTGCGGETVTYGGMLVISVVRVVPIIDQCIMPSSGRGYGCAELQLIKGVSAWCRSGVVVSPAPESCIKSANAFCMFAWRKHFGGCQISTV